MSNSCSIQNMFDHNAPYPGKKTPEIESWKVQTKIRKVTENNHNKKCDVERQRNNEKCHSRCQAETGPERAKFPISSNKKKTALGCLVVFFKITLPSYTRGLYVLNHSKGSLWTNRTSIADATPRVASRFASFMDSSTAKAAASWQG